MKQGHLKDQKHYGGNNKLSVIILCNVLKQTAH